MNLVSIGVITEDVKRVADSAMTGDGVGAVYRDFAQLATENSHASHWQQENPVIIGRSAF